MFGGEHKATRYWSTLHNDKSHNLLEHAETIHFTEIIHRTEMMQTL
jgi:hypothetical protein